MNAYDPNARHTTPLRLLEVLEPSGGGSGRHMLDLCRGMSQRGHHVEAVYSPLRAEETFVRELKSLGLPAVHSVDMKRSPGLSDIAAHRKLRSIIGKDRFDIIHGHSSKAGALTRLRLPGLHVPRVYTPHAFRTMDPSLGKGGSLIYGTIENLLARHFTDRLICVSEDEYRHALSLGMPAKTLSVVVNGAAPPPADMARTVRSTFGIPDDAFLFGFIGRLCAQKAPLRLVEAFRLLASKNPHAQLLMVGSGELEEDVARAIADSGLADRMHLTKTFTGPQAVGAFDLLVMPSLYEAMSYVMLEGAAAGKPILCTAFGGASTVIEDGRNGRIIANDGDMAKLAAAMLECAEPERHTILASEAERTASRFSLGAMLDLTESVYLRLAGHAPLATASEAHLPGKHSFAPAPRTIA
ncbi:glycosyltransferase involved in cell wall biosynthesis [Pararhizobium capsulatum DSM 1112]|uniref:Glycosyltransferase involved in cell wall biosynthesis n=1 Tax=Pararhizobium capsulatum DSM 1112 TaxID=1121113 RepID=A0ABU0BNN0_9HYPH|nr:glycosyltransferase [Pararhizobium capsulatum]MDQ0319859.1 glycosyltransferase involved in cell wall biosynthesis [Pararhizobium capsulatum DSM 1112]